MNHNDSVRAGFKPAPTAAPVPYPAYKDSGVPWLGTIPVHWKIKPLKHWVRINARTLAETTPPEYEFRYLDIRSVGTGFLTEQPQRLRFADAPSRARRVLQQGDTIVSTVRTYLKAVFFIDGDDKDFIASTGFAVLSPGHHVNPKYLSFLVQSDPFTNRVSADSVGIAYPAIAETKVSAFHVAMPMLEEQAAIVRYLDHADRRIRRYIAAKRRLIALLNEQKQAIIHRAVTRGLDPNARLKPSGVEWLGDVPDGWEIIKLRRLIRLNPSKSEASKSAYDEVVFLPMEKVSEDGRIDNSERRRLADIEQGFPYFRKHDVILAKITPCFENGKGAYLDKLETDFGFGSTEFIVLRAGPRIHPKYLYHITVEPMFRKLGADAMTGAAGQQRVPSDFVRNFDIALPSLVEQERILAYIENESLRISTAIARTQREIDLIREYRTRLIADVVTGKLDVRAAAATLPDDVDAPESYADVLAEEDDVSEDADAEAVADDM